MKALNEMTNNELVELFSFRDLDRQTFYVVGTDIEYGFEREISFIQYKKVNEYIELGEEMYNYPGYKTDKMSKEAHEEWSKLYNKQNNLYKELIEEGVFKSKYNVRQEIKVMDTLEFVKYMQGAKAYKEAYLKYIYIAIISEEDEE